MSAHRFNEMLRLDRILDIRCHLIPESPVHRLESDFNAVVEQGSNGWSNCPAKPLRRKGMRGQNAPGTAAKLIRLKSIVSENTTANAEIRLNWGLCGGDAG